MGAGGHLPEHWVLLTGHRSRVAGVVSLPALLDAAGPPRGIAAAIGPWPNPLHWTGLPPTLQLLLMLAAKLSNLHPSPEFCPWCKGGSHQPWRWALANVCLCRVTPTTLPHPPEALVPLAFLVPPPQSLWAWGLKLRNTPRFPFPG